MPQPLSVEEERKRRKKLPSPIPPLPGAIAGQTAGQLAGIQRRMAALPTGTPEYNELAREAEELERLLAEAVPSLRQQAGQLRTLAMRPLETPEAVEKYPGFLQPVGRAFRELTSPAQIALMAATAGLGPPAAAVIRGGTGVLGVARGLAAGAAAPVLAKAPFAPRLAAEAGINLAAILGAQEAARRIPETAPWPVRVGLPLAAGLAGAGGVLAAGRVLPPLARAGGREIITTPAVREKLLKAAMPLRMAEEGIPLTKPGEINQLERLLKSEQVPLEDAKQVLAAVENADIAALEQLPVLPDKVDAWLSRLFAKIQNRAGMAVEAQMRRPEDKSFILREPPRAEVAPAAKRWAETYDELLKQAETIQARQDIEGAAREAPPTAKEYDALVRAGRVVRRAEVPPAAKAAEPPSPIAAKAPYRTETEAAADAASRAGQPVTLWRGEPRGIRPEAEGPVPFSLDRQVAQGWAGSEGRVVAVTLPSDEIARLSAERLPGKMLTYRVPQEIYKRAIEVPQPAAAKPLGPIAAEVALTGPARYRQHLKDKIGELDALGATDAAYSWVVDPRYTRFQRKPTETWRDYAMRVAGSKVPKPPSPIAAKAAEVAPPRAAVAGALARQEAELAAQPPKRYFLREEPEPLLPSGKKYMVYEADGTPRYLAGATPEEAVVRLRQAEPNAVVEGFQSPRAAEPLPPPAVAEAAQAQVGPTRAETPPSAAAPPPVKPPTEPPVRGGPPEPPEDALKRLATYIHSPESLKLSDLTIQMRKAEAGQRITRFASRVEELLAQGKKTQEAIDQATKETMGGKFERPISALTESMAKEFEEAGFARIHAVLKDEPWEEISTAGALRNALEGKGIPRIVGVEGGSAYTRLSRVFPPEVMEVLGKGKPLAQVFEDARLSGPGREWQPHEIPGPTWERAEQGLFPGVFPSKGSLGRLSQEEVRQRWLASFPEGQPYEIPGQPWERAEQLGLAPKPPPMEPRPRLTPQEMERQKQLLEGYLVGQMPTPRGVPEPLILPTLEKETRQALIPLVPSSHREVILRVAKEAGLNVMDVLNFMRANKSSFDLSFWRQMAMLAPANKRAFWRANLRGLKAAKSAEFAKAFDDSIRADLRYYTWYERLGLDFLRPLEQKGLPAYKRTEEFLIMGGERPLQKLAGKLPHLRISQRAFVTSTNAMTWDIFKGYVDDMLAQNAKIAAGKKVLKPGEVFDVEGNIKALGTMLEDMSGRAQLGKPLQGLSGPLNAGLFAVRFSLGRFLTPRHLLSANPMVRREAWKNVLAFVGTITAVEMLGEGLGLWSVGKDPRSPNFRKIRIGNTWYDPWGGFLQYAVLTARLMSRQRVDELTGRRTPANPIDTLTWFVRGKGAPGASLLADFATGTTFLGEKTNIRDLRQWVNRIAPMSLEDFYDVAEEEGAWGIAMGIPGIVGIGMATYGLRENWSKELAPYYAIPANELEVKAKKLPLTRNNYRKRNPEVDAKLFIAGDVESLRTMTARHQVVQLMRQLKVRPQDVEGLQEKEYESKERKALRLWILRALGQSPRPPLPGTRGGSPPVPSWDYQYR